MSNSEIINKRFALKTDCWDCPARWIWLKVVSIVRLGKGGEFFSSNFTHPLALISPLSVRTKWCKICNTVWEGYSHYCTSVSGLFLPHPDICKSTITSPQEYNAVGNLGRVFHILSIRRNMGYWILGELCQFDVHVCVRFHVPFGVRVRFRPCQCLKWRCEYIQYAWYGNYLFNSKGLYEIAHERG